VYEVTTPALRLHKTVVKLGRRCFPFPPHTATCSRSRSFFFTAGLASHFDYENYLPAPDDGKRRLERGIDDSWIVEPELELVKGYRRHERSKRFDEKTESSREQGGTLWTPLLPGFDSSLDALFA
jgi:hypothetical protein